MANSLGGNHGQVGSCIRRYRFAGWDRISGPSTLFIPLSEDPIL